MNRPFSEDELRFLATQKIKMGLGISLEKGFGKKSGRTKRLLARHENKAFNNVAKNIIIGKE